MPALQKPLWGTLAPFLIAELFEVSTDPDKPAEFGQQIGDTVVYAPIQEGAQISMQFNWQSPFEHMGPESKLPALSAMLQSGTLQAFGNGAEGAAESRTRSDSFTGRALGLFDSAQSEAGAALANIGRAARGRTGITRLNSTQTFSGAPPAKISMTLLFRAWKNAQTEVEDHINQIRAWAMPKELSDFGALGVIAAGQETGGETGTAKFINAIFPSLAPTVIGMRYRNRQFPPMVIEGIEEPLTSPSDSDGRSVEVALPISVGFLTALDVSDMKKYLAHGTARAAIR